MTTEPAPIAPITIDPSVLAAVTGQPAKPYSNVMKTEVYRDDRGIQVERRWVVAGTTPRDFAPWRLVMPIYDNSNNRIGTDMVPLDVPADAELSVVFDPLTDEFMQATYLESCKRFVAEKERRLAELRKNQPRISVPGQTPFAHR
jgi:hypothetical protein